MDVHLALQPSCSLREYSRPCTEIAQHYGTIFRCMTHSYVPVEPLWIETFLSWNLTPPPSKHGISHPDIISLGGCSSVRLFLGLSVHTLISFILQLYEVVPLWGTLCSLEWVIRQLPVLMKIELLVHLTQRSGLPAADLNTETPTAMWACRLNSAFTANHSLVHTFHSKLKPLYTLNI